MLILPKQEALFYHVYRVAGSSIRKALLPYADKRHAIAQWLNHGLKNARLPYSDNPVLHYHPHLADVRDAMGVRFDELYKFAFVREPLDWQHSYFHYARTRRHHHHHDIASRLTFDRYLSWKLDNAFHTQTEYLFDGDTCLVDDIFHYETLEHDWAALAGRLGIEPPLPRINAAASGEALEISPQVFDRFVRMAESDYRLLGYDIVRPTQG